MTVKVPTTGQPFWLVLGQSFSSGWTASAGGRSLGTPKLIDAYANGWYVPARPAGGTLIVQLRWAPQTVIWAALATSGAAIILCVLLAVLPEGGAGGSGRRVRLRRRRRAPGPAIAGASGAPPVWGAAPEPAAWRSFLRPGAVGVGPSWRKGMVTALVWGAVVAFVSRPAIGALAAAGVVVAARWRWGRAACRCISIGGLLALPAYAVFEQVAHHYWPDIGWPADLSSANDIAWFALAILGSDAVAGALYARRRMEDAR